MDTVGLNSGVYDGSSSINHRGEALICFVTSHCDALELFEFAEEILDQVTPFVNFGVDIKRFRAPWVLGDNDFRAAFIKGFDDRIQDRKLYRRSVRRTGPPRSGVRTTTVSKRWLGSSSKRTRLRKASVRARIFVVIAPFDLPMAWL